MDSAESIYTGGKNNRNAGYHLLLVCLCWCFLTTSATADTWGPWEVPGSSPNRTAKDRIDPLDQTVKFFQKYISPVDGARCPMYPTCSAYARQALRKHGSFLGIFITADRLIHEGDPIEQQESIIKWGLKRYYDPLINNDFWLLPL